MMNDEPGCCASCVVSIANMNLFQTNTKHPTSAQTPGRTIIDLPLPGQQTEHRHDNNRPQELVKEFIPTLEKQFSGDTVNVRDPKETPTLAVNFNSVLSTKEIAGDAVNDAGKSMPTENGGATNNDDVNGASRNAASRQCSSLLPHSDSLASTDIPFDNEDDDDDDDTSDDLLNQEDVLSHHHHHHLLYHHNTEARSEMRDENPLKTCSVVAGGKAVLIEVDRNNLPVGVLLIGGQDTAMVRSFPSFYHLHLLLLLQNYDSFHERVHLFTLLLKFIFVDFALIRNNFFK